MLVIFMSTYFLPHSLHKSQPSRFTVGFLEDEGLISLFCVKEEGVSKIGYIA